MIRVYAHASGLSLEQNGEIRTPVPAFSPDDIFCSDDPVALVEAAFAAGRPAGGVLGAGPAAVLQSQEIWAAGVTYLQSKTARMEESKDGGGGSFYDKVYAADRPEIFFKATPHRVVAPGAAVRIRSDSKWNVPEPELTLAINAHGKIFGYTIGNDMSSRDIEGENPLYLPQAKVYSGCASVGPCLVVTRTLPTPDTVISIEIRRAGQTMFEGATTVGRIKRPLPSLVDWLFRDNSFPRGCYLMTGTGIVPPDGFTLQKGDEIHISLAPVGTLINTVE